MTLLKGVLIVLAIAIYGYTLVVIGRDGFGLIPVFFGNLFAVNWSGQFNLDFATYLILSALWVAWRHKFSGAGLMMAAIASVAGMAFFAPYLLVQMRRADSVGALLLGAQGKKGAQ